MSLRRNKKFTIRSKNYKRKSPSKNYKRKKSKIHSKKHSKKHSKRHTRKQKKSVTMKMELLDKLLCNYKPANCNDVWFYCKKGCEREQFNKERINIFKVTAKDVERYYKSRFFNTKSPNDERLDKEIIKHYIEKIIHKGLPEDIRKDIDENKDDPYKIIDKYIDILIKDIEISHPSKKYFLDELIKVIESEDNFYSFFNNSY